MGRDQYSYQLRRSLNPVTRAASFALIQVDVAASADPDMADGLDGGGLATLVDFVWEIAKVRAFSWYAGATGFAAASAPWLVGATVRLPKAATYNSVELRFALVFFLAGLISGSIYCLLAGRNVDKRMAN